MVHKMYSKREVSGQSFGYLLITAATATLLGACSADISRFNFNDKPTTTGALQSTTPPEPVYGSRSGLGRNAQNDSFDSVDRGTLQAPDQQPRAPSYKTTHLNAPSSREAPYRLKAASPIVPPVAYDDRPRQPEMVNSSVRTDANASADQGQTTKGQSIFVSRGDTLYGLSRRHGTTVNALMNANNLSSSTLQPGQKLYLPSGIEANTAARQPTSIQTTPVVAAEAPGHWTDTYTIQRGDSLYKLSRRYNVKTRDLKRFNGIANPRALKPGMVLKVPGPGGDNGTIAARPSAREVTTRKVKSRPIVGSPTILNSARTEPAVKKETQVAAVKPTTTTDAGRYSGQSMTVRPDKATRNSIAGTSKLRWPARGRIISGFGKRNDGTHNDGINVAVPLGTKIHAAEGGMVAYAGDELKGYGNLVLIRHDNGWVTAYAHAEKLLVKRGDRIRRGDVIAKAGKTGEVSQPQLHFEVRQGQKPVDPIPFMDRL